MWNNMGVQYENRCNQSQGSGAPKKGFRSCHRPTWSKCEPCNSHADGEQYVAEEKEMQHRRAETLEAIEDIASRRVVSGEKVMDWLAGWGTDSETEAP
jgi:hypothetical protein